MKKFGFIFSFLFCFSTHLYPLDITKINPDYPFSGIFDYSLYADITPGQNVEEVLLQRKQAIFKAKIEDPAYEFNENLYQFSLAKTVQAGVAAVPQTCAAALLGQNRNALSLKGAVTIAFCVSAANSMLGDKGYHDRKNLTDSRIKSFKDRLEKEEIISFEEDYLLRKNEYNDEWQTIIEKTFLAFRKEPSFLDRGPKPLDLIKDLLAFPTDVHVASAFVRSDNPLRAVSDHIKALFQAPPQGNIYPGFYKGDLREQLVMTMQKIAKCARNARENNEGPKRASFIFYGEPGSGKTEAAKMIARELELPYYVAKLTASTFNPEYLYGGQGRERNIKGEFLQTFLQEYVGKDKNGQEIKHRAKNAVLILDDVDRLFKKNNKGNRNGNGSGHIAILNQLTKDLTDFDAKYYGIENFDCANLIVICITNTDFSSAEHLEEFAPFLGRCGGLISFKATSARSRKEMLKTYLSDELIGNNALGFVDLGTDHYPRLRHDVVTFLVDFYDHYDTRILQDRALKLLDYPQDEWLALAEKTDWGKTTPKMEKLRLLDHLEETIATEDAKALATFVVDDCIFTTFEEAVSRIEELIEFHENEWKDHAISQGWCPPSLPQPVAVETKD